MTPWLRRYRTLAVQFHPDKNPDDPEGAAQKFMRVSKVRKPSSA